MKDTNLLELLFDNGIDVRGRKIYLHGGLSGEDEYNVEYLNVIKSLQYLDKNTGDIELWINTPGGYISEMFGIYDVIRSSKNIIKTIGFGTVCSAGVLILMSGDKRICTPACSLMIHQPNYELPGSISWHKDFVKESEKQFNLICKLYEKHSNKSFSWWKKTLQYEKEIWLDPKQMLSYGIIDEVMEID